MPDVFEYDVFLSFASADEKIVKPIWQDLCQSDSECSGRPPL
jgi:hypothetical protein